VRIKAVLLYVFVSAATIYSAFAGHPVSLLCEVMENVLPAWIYQKSQNAQRHKISVNGSLGTDHNDRYTIEGSSLIINEVRDSDAGIYLCGRGNALLHKVQLSISGVCVLISTGWPTKNDATTFDCSHMQNA